MTTPWMELLNCRRLRRKILPDPISPENFLSGIARRYPTHAFLGNATQGVYLRQVRFLAEYCGSLFHKKTSAIKVLDWGCGKGHISYLLKRQGFQTTSCDRNKPSDDSSFGQETPILSREKIKIIPLEDDVRLPFKNRTFDLVVSFGVLEHVPRDEESMVEIRRVLKPGGVFFVSFLPYFLSWTQFVARLRGDDYHDRLYSEGGFRRLADRTGWKVVDLWHGQLFPKNSFSGPNPNRFERWDRFLTDSTPLRFFATNLECVLIPKK
jgi:SAM-dependent methyltransferase